MYNKSAEAFSIQGTRDEVVSLERTDEEVEICVGATMSTLVLVLSLS